jgi:hypothetical protein
LVGMPEYVVGRSYVIFLSAKAAGSPYTAPVSLGQVCSRFPRGVMGRFVLGTSSTMRMFTRV